MTYYAHWTLQGQQEAADALASGKALKGLVVMAGVLPPPPRAATPKDDRQLELPFDLPPAVPPAAGPSSESPASGDLPADTRPTHGTMRQDMHFQLAEASTAC